jgi:hypothetical protein
VQNFARRTLIETKKELAIGQLEKSNLRELMRKEQRRRTGGSAKKKNAKQAQGQP